MLILQRLEVPQVPLILENDKYNLDSILAYLQSLVGYFYSCNAPLSDDILGQGQGSANYNEGSFTITATGFAVNPTSTARFVQVGKQTTIIFPQIQSTSNATTMTITGIPATLVAAYPAWVMIPTFDNGFVPVNGMVLADATTTWTVFSNSVGAGWTAAGIKGFQNCAVTYISI